jgi:hypothetical protein
LPCPLVVTLQSFGFVVVNFIFLMVFIGQENTIWNSITMIKEGTKAVKTVIS